MVETSRALIVGLIVGLLGGLLLAGCDRQSPAPVQANQASAAPLADEAVADTTPGSKEVKPDFSHAGEAAPAVTFAEPAGQAVTLAALRGRPVLVNLWATWCAPCVAELPTLAALAKREAGKLTVLTVSQDMKPEVAAPFLARRGVTLPAYTDPKLGLSVAYAANLPTTVLYGADGKERWRVTGGMDWAGTEAAGLIARAGGQ